MSSPKKLNNWQSNTKTATERLDRLKSDGTLSDMTLTVGQGAKKKSFKCHSMVLAMSSNVFEKMLFGDLAPKEKNGKKNVDITDIEPDIIERLLSYIYTDVHGLENVADAILLHAAANKYLLDNLEQKCLDYLVENTSDSNALRVLEYAVFISNNTLKDVAIQVISINANELLKSAEFVKIEEFAMKVLLAECRFRCKEMDVFEALLKYGQKRLSKDTPKKGAKTDMKAVRSYLISHDLLKTINVTAISPHELVNTVKPTGIFTVEECFDILSFILECGKVLPPFLSTDHLRRAAIDTNTIPPIVCKNKRSLMRTPVYAKSYIKLDANLELHQSCPDVTFECNLLIKADVNTCIAKLTYNGHKHCKAEVEAFPFEDESQLLFSHADISEKGLLGAEPELKADVLYRVYMRFSRVSQNTALKSFKFAEKRVEESLGDNANVVIEMAGWVPGHVILDFRTIVRYE